VIRGAVLILALSFVAAQPRAVAAASVAVALRASDGVALTATLYEADSAAPAVVLVHMYTRSKDDWRTFAERLQSQGLTALAVDLRGHGGSGGAPTPAVAMALDVRAAIDFLAARPGVRGIGVAGASLGASLALLAAAEVSMVRGVALLSPASDYRGVRLDAASRKYGGRPLLLIASSADPYALRTLRDLIPEASTSRDQRVSAVVGHGTQLVDRDPDVATALVDWLRRTLLS